jgi:hypothetical protein
MKVRLVIVAAACLLATTKEDRIVDLLKKLGWQPQ